MTAPGPKVTILYDADCGFCRWSVALLLARDGNGALVPEAIQGPAGERLLAHMTPAERLARAHVATADGRVFSGGDGLAPVLHALEAPRPLVATVARASRPVRWVYGQIAARRSTLGRLLVSDRRRRAADAAIERHRARVMRGIPTAEPDSPA
jgi:predicted DCC family thiol-disulfide oxidoreductase YuxK